MQEAVNLTITFWGTRGSIPSPGEETVRYGGNTTCLELQLSDGTTIIIDAGTGIKKLGQKLLEKSREQEIYLFFTHSHWDHIQGFPLFAPAYIKSFKINIYSCIPVFDNVKEILTNQMDPRYFPVRFNNLKAEINFHPIEQDSFRLGSAVIECIANNHPGGADGFKFSEHGKSLVFITDNELHVPNNSNSSWEEFVNFCRGAEMLIHDAHYLDEELKDTTGWGHSSYEQTFKLAMEAKVKHLIFFHHDPDRTDDEIDQIVDKYRKKAKKMKLDLKLDAAIEGKTYRI